MAAAAAAASATAAAAAAAGFHSEGVPSPAGGISHFQRSASLEPQRACSAGARWRDPSFGTTYSGFDCTAMSGGGMCGGLSPRGLAPQGDAQERVFKPRAPASPRPRQAPWCIASSKDAGRESSDGRISALKSELDLLKSRTGSIRQQLQHFMASQSSRLTHSTDEAAEQREPRFADGFPEG